MPVLFTEVGSFLTFPMELIFSHIKRRFQQQWLTKVKQDAKQNRISHERPFKPIEII
jgi:hypothetical protein